MKLHLLTLVFIIRLIISNIWTYSMMSAYDARLSIMEGVAADIISGAYTGEDAVEKLERAHFKHLTEQHELELEERTVDCY